MCYVCVRLSLFVLMVTGCCKLFRLSVCDRAPLAPLCVRTRWYCRGEVGDRCLLVAVHTHCTGVLFISFGLNMHAGVVLAKGCGHTKPHPLVV